MWPLWTRITAWLLTAITIIGNGLVIYLITTRRKLRTKTNWFILSLAVVDFAFGVTYFPQKSCCKIYKICANHVKDILFCIEVFLMYASVMNLCTLTLDRYLAIVKPMRYITFMTTKRVVLLISAAWGVAFVGVLIPCLTLYFATSRKTRAAMHRSFWLLLDILSFCVWVFLLFATTRMFLIARRHARQNAALVTQLNFNHIIEKGRVFKPQEAAATKMVGIVVSVFVICYFLDFFDTVCHRVGYDAQKKILHVILPLLRLLNSAINPVAYALFKRQFRIELKPFILLQKTAVEPISPHLLSNGKR